MALCFVTAKDSKLSPQSGNGLRGVKAMLQKLADHIAAANAMAAEAEECAKRATDESSRNDHLQMAKAWHHVAKSYEFVVTLERFLIDAHRSGSLVKVSELPKPPSLPD
jgi:hypothetical protein